MIAEIKGKISSTGSNLSDRLEDNLTGNFFGTLRYMSFENGLKKILLNSITPKNNKVLEIINNIEVEEWDEYIQFWPYDREGEIDVILEFDNCVIGIEVKYLSGISSDDNVSNDDLKEYEESIQQLSRESRIISRKGQNKEKILIFIADQLSCIDVYKDVTKRNIIEKDVNMVYISWQNILETMKYLKCENKYEKVIINDLINLLTKKGFEQFKNFTIDDVNVSCDDYFKFGNIEKEINQDYICFLEIEKIEGDLYYEF